MAKLCRRAPSHFLGQNFAKAFDVKFSDKNNKLDYVWATSWGVSTRLIGALVMAHSDDDGLILPPKIAPQQVVIVPIYKNEEQKNAISQKVKEITAALKQMNIRVKYDDNDNMRPGWKFAEYEMKGVPVRITIGPKDLENNAAEVARRDLRKRRASVLILSQMMWWHCWMIFKMAYSTRLKNSWMNILPR
jgi:prolyl-tRNA synthetase